MNVYESGAVTQMGLAESLELHRVLQRLRQREGRGVRKDVRLERG
jgi:hypothetical protein